MKIQSLTLDYPPRRHIGSELFTHRLNVALVAAHEVRAATVSVKTNPGFERIPVEPFGWSDKSWADLFICHTDYAGPVMALGKPVVGICHNTQEGVLLGVHTHRFALVVCNSDAMKAELEQRDSQPYMVVHPPAPPVGPLSSGDMVTIVNLNENKLGLFWDIAAALPEQKFLAVAGGYGEQIIPPIVPSNVEIVGHVPQAQMWDKVWARTRLLLAPSRRESWNMTAGEALAHGVPTVATDIPGVRENLGATATYLDRDDLPAWVATVAAARTPNGRIQERAQSNHDRFNADVASYVKAVSALGDSHRQAA